jgi:hypothetical protein
MELLRRKVSQIRGNRAEAEKHAEKVLRSGKIKIRRSHLFRYWLLKQQQRDLLSYRLLRFATALAIALQEDLEQGMKLTDRLVDKRVKELDYLGLSGYAYDIVKKFLKDSWQYGKLLPW